MMPGSDVDTIANADVLWKLVHLVQDTIDKDGSALLVGMDNKYETALADLRKLADQLDPENGRY